MKVNGKDYPIYYGKNDWNHQPEYDDTYRYYIFTFAVNDYLTSIHAYYTQAVFNGKGCQFFSPAASGSAGEVSDNKQNTS